MDLGPDSHLKFLHLALMAHVRERIMTALIPAPQDGGNVSGLL